MNRTDITRSLLNGFRQIVEMLSVRASIGHNVPPTPRPSIRKDPEPLYKDPFKQDLLDAAIRGNADDLRNLLTFVGSDSSYLNARYADGGTLLMVAVSWGNVECAKLLLKRGADVNASNEDGQTALMKAAATGNVDCLKLLLSYHADVNAKERFTRSNIGFRSSTNEGGRECADIMLRHGAVDDPSGGATALDWALVKAGQPDRRLDAYNRPKVTSTFRPWTPQTINLN